MVINHNISSLNTNRQLQINSMNAQKAISKLSSGLRINSAADDAAGLAISEKMKAQISGLDQASRNAQDGISMVQTAEGALNETTSILQRMRELADQSANGTNTDDDRKAMQDEVTQLKSEIDRIGDTTEFNTRKLLNGDLKSAGGASVGENATTGSIVAKLTNATLTGSSTLASMAALVAGNFTKETINIDGTNIDINWQNLSSDDQSTIESAVTGTAQQQNDAAALIVKNINDAIDAAGGKVAHITGYVSGGKLVLQSGSTGTTSDIKVTTGSIVNGLIGATAAAAGATGSSLYNGTTVASNGTFNFTVNGVTMQASVAQAIDNTTPMASAANLLASAINAAITNANNAAGAASSSDPGYINKVTVNATNDGRFQVLSQSGPISFQDLAGKTSVSDLGLSQAKTDASGNGGMAFQIGANQGQSLTFGINDMRSAALGIAGVDITSVAGAQNAMTTIDKAISSVSSERAKLGAIENRLEHTINNLGTSSENLTAAQSRITDVDMASEMTEFTKDNILSQAAQAMLAQANQQPQGVLQLLR